jgi:hypothetical protein
MHADPVHSISASVSGSDNIKQAGMRLMILLYLPSYKRFFYKFGFLAHRVF